MTGNVRVIVKWLKKVGCTVWVGGQFVPSSESERIWKKRRGVLKTTKDSLMFIQVFFSRALNRLLVVQSVLKAEEVAKMSVPFNSELLLCRETQLSQLKTVTDCNYISKAN